MATKKNTLSHEGGARCGLSFRSTLASMDYKRGAPAPPGPARQGHIDRAGLEPPRSNPAVHVPMHAQRRKEAFHEQGRIQAAEPAFLRLNPSPNRCGLKGRGQGNRPGAPGFSPIAIVLGRDVLPYFANSMHRVSRTTVTRIWPGYCKVSS